MRMFIKYNPLSSTINYYMKLFIMCYYVLINKCYYVDKSVDNLNVNLWIFCFVFMCYVGYYTITPYVYNDNDNQYLFI